MTEITTQNVHVSTCNNLDSNLNSCFEVSERTLSIYYNSNKNQYQNKKLNRSPDSCIQTELNRTEPSQIDSHKAPAVSLTADRSVKQHPRLAVHFAWSLFCRITYADTQTLCERAIVW